MGIMFYMNKIKKSVHLTPKEINPSLKECLMSKAAIDIEGTCDDINGCIIAVDSYAKFGAGTVKYGTGKVFFEIDSNCLVCKPEIGEVLAVIVNEVMQNIIIAAAGPIIVVIHRNKDEKLRDVIAPGAELRVKILSRRNSMVEQRETMLCIGSIDGSYLGLFTT